MCNNPPYYPAPPTQPPPPWASSSNSATVTIPPMPAVVSAPAAEPESASVKLLRSLLLDRRRTKKDAETQRDGLNEQAANYRSVADEAERQAGNAGLVVAAAETEIAAILADIKTLGGRDE